MIFVAITSVEKFNAAKSISVLLLQRYMRYG